jgi:hypothetical protein
MVLTNLFRSTTHTDSTRTTLILESVLSPIKRDWEGRLNRDDLKQVYKSYKLK